MWVEKAQLTYHSHVDTSLLDWWLSGHPRYSDLGFAQVYTSIIIVKYRGEGEREGGGATIPVHCVNSKSSSYFDD